MTAPTDNTPLSIISDAYRDAGLTQLGDTVGGEMLVEGMRKLTDLINYKQTKGLRLWLNSDQSITLVSGTATYTLGPSGTVVIVKPLRVLEAYYLASDDVRRPLIPLAWRDYLNLSSATQEGSVNSYFVDKQATQLSVSFWQVPDDTAATGTVHLLVQTQVTNFISVTETMNFPIEWRMYLRWGLADQLSMGQPQAIMDRCAQYAMMYGDALDDWDVEDAPTSFAPDSRSGFFAGRFR